MFPFTAVESGRAPAAKMPKKMPPDKAKKASKERTKDAAEAIEAAIEAAAKADAARDAAKAALLALREAREAAEDMSAAGLDMDTLTAFWRLRDGLSRGALLARSMDGSQQPRQRHLEDILRLAELPTKAIEELAERLGKGVNDGQLAAHRQRRRLFEARGMIARELIFAAASGDDVSGQELAERAWKRAFPRAADRFSRPSRSRYL